MGKGWKAAFVVVVLLTFSLLVATLFYMKRAPAMIASALSEKLQVPVRVESVKFSFNSIVIKGFEIKNLPESILPTAFSAQTIIIKCPITNFLKKDVHIDHIIVDDIYIGLEFDNIKSEKGNWTRLMENYYSKIDAPAEKELKRTVHIERISLQQIRAQVVYKTDPGNIHTLPLVPYEEFTNISSTGGVPLDQIANSVLGKMLLSLFARENLKNMFQQFFNPENAVKHLIAPFKLFVP